MKTENEKYCSNCGSVIDHRAELCPKCGVRQTNTISIEKEFDPSVSDKDWLTTLLLCIFTGALGVHRFYTGNTLIGILQLVTAGGCGVWALIDLIMIVTGSFKDAEGRVVKQK